jgi:sulfotransferase
MLLVQLISGKMNNKTYYFLAGMPRSGNTLLSALLNQNPKIYSSPLSPVCEQMYRLTLTLQDATGLRNEENSERTKYILNNYMDNFYYDINKPIIFDREKYWLTPPNLDVILNYITPNPKIIFTVRNYVDILASYINLSLADIEYEIENQHLYIKDLPRYDLIAEFLSRTNSSLDLSMLCVRTGLKEEYKKYVHFVDYEDLVTSPEQTLKDLYFFLEEEPFNHDLNNIQKLEIDRDDKVNQNTLTHFVSPSIIPSQLKGSEIFSDSILKKYSNMNIWKNNVDK